MRLFLLSVSMILLTPLITFAQPCTELANKIHTDIHQYGASIRTQKLAWQDIKYLQAALGEPKKEEETDKINYTWVCPEKNGSYIRYVTDPNGQFMYVTGEYNSSNGSGLFASQMTQTSTTTMTTSLTTTAPPLNSPACANTLTQIGKDYAQYGANVKNQQLPWMNLDYLKQQLGTASTTPMQQIFASWNDYSVFVDGLGGFISSGQLPPGLNNSKIMLQSNGERMTQLINLLGQPTQKIEDSMTLYKWQCTDQASLMVVVDNTNKMMSLNAQVCSDAKCVPLIFNLAYGPAYTAYNKLADSSLQIQIQATKTETIKEFNRHFQLSVKDDAQMYTAMIEKMKSFYKNVRACTLGTYTFAKQMPSGLVYPIATILGMQNNRCEVEISYQLNPNDFMDLKCQFKQESLALFTDEQAAQNIQAKPSNGARALDKVMVDQCKATINGVSVPVV